MTCETARTLLLFYRPGANPDLAAEDVAALEQHLAGCPDCAARSARQAGDDAAIGRAVRQVTVQVGLRDQLQVHAIAATGRAWWNKWLTRANAAALVAAAGLLGWGGYVAATRPALDTYAAAMAHETAIERPDQTVRDWLSGVGVRGPLAEDFNFQNLGFHGYAELQGQRVPVLEFRNGGLGFARVYLLRPGQFAVKDATETQTSLVTVRLYKGSPAAGWTTVVVHTGPSLQPFLRVPAPTG
jgi:hypothetical protein